MSSLQDDIQAEIVSWDEIHKHGRILARKVMQHREDKPFTGIIAITRGGLIPAAILARELGIKLIDNVCCEAYKDSEAALKDGEVKFFKKADAAGEGDNWLLVDDLVDTGKTAKAVRAELPKALFVTLYAKPEGRPLVDMFVKEVEQDCWVFFPWDTHLAYAKPISHRGD